MSQLVLPFDFSPGEVIYSAQMNANFAAVADAVNGIDSTNIGAAGIYASDIIPTSSPEATFGGSVAYTFPSSVVLGTAGSATSTGIRMGNGVSSQTLLDTNPVTVGGVSSTLLRVGNSGGGSLLALDNSGDLGIAGTITASGTVAATLASVLAILPPMFLANGTSIAATAHIVFGTATFTTAATVAVSLTGAAQFTSGATYAVFAGGNTGSSYYSVTSISQTAAGFSLVNYVGGSTALLPNPTTVPWVAIGY